MGTVADLVLARAGDPRPAIVFEDQVISYRDWVRACARRANWLLDNMRDGAPPHVGVLLDNVPDFPTWLGAAALAGAVVVGINPTRRGAELVRDVEHTNCQLIITESKYTELLDDSGVRLPMVVSDEVELDGQSDAVPDVKVQDTDLYLLLFTSGVSGRPKACRCTHGRLAFVGAVVADMFELTADDVCYQAMPMFHSNALMAGWAPALAAGATSALRRKFSASEFLSDVRKYGVTYFNYVGKPLSYIVATPEQPDDADNPLRRVFGNEAAEADIARFAQRFGCTVHDAYGSTEGGANVSRVPELPAGAFGQMNDSIAVLDVNGHDCPPARFDSSGRLLNADQAIGELVSKTGAATFEGYYKDPDAEAQRVRDGWYWTGDLVYRDTDGFLYFAGRGDDWLRVDGENFAAAPIERILMRHPDVALAAVYAVPDEHVGDQVMAAVLLRPGRPFDADQFGMFLESQADLGTKWAPKFIRVVDTFPMTETGKVIKRTLRSERWACSDPVFWRPERGLRYEPLRAAEADRLSTATQVRAL